MTAGNGSHPLDAALQPILGAAHAAATAAGEEPIALLVCVLTTTSGAHVVGANKNDTPVALRFVEDLKALIGALSGSSADPLHKLLEHMPRIVEAALDVVKSGPAAGVPDLAFIGQLTRLRKALGDAGAMPK